MAVPQVLPKALAGGELRADPDGPAGGVRPRHAWDPGALLLQALELGGKEAADLLMAPVAATFPFPDFQSRPGTVHAIDALIRAGGDPAPALAALVDALGDRQCRAAGDNYLDIHRQAPLTLPTWVLTEHCDRAAVGTRPGIGDTKAMSRVCLECRPSSRSTRRGPATP